MLPDRVSNLGPLTYESGALPISLRGPAFLLIKVKMPTFMSGKNRRYCTNLEQKKIRSLFLVYEK